MLLTPSTQRLRPGLPGYLIPFAPLAFVPQRQYSSREPLSPLVFLHISTHFTATRAVPFSSPRLQPASIGGSFAVGPQPFTPNLTDRLRTLYAQ